MFEFLEKFRLHFYFTHLRQKSSFNYKPQGSFFLLGQNCGEDILLLCKTFCFTRMIVSNFSSIFRDIRVLLVQSFSSKPRYIMCGIHNVHNSILTGDLSLTRARN